MKTLIATLILSLLVLAVSGSAAAAAEQYWTIGADIGVYYDSNVFATDTATESDFITELRPWAELKYPIGDISILKMKYTLAGKMYSEFSDANTVGHDLNVELGITGSTFYSKLSGAFVYTSYPIQPIVAGKADNWQSNFSALVGAGYDKLGWEVGLAWDKQTYLDFSAVDNDDISLWLEGNYKLSEKHSTYAKATFGTVSYSDAVHNEADYIDFRIGLRGNPSQHLDYDVNAGFQSRDYDDAGTLADTSDYSSVTLAAKLGYRASAKTKLAANLTYKPSEAVTANYFETIFLGLSAESELTARIGVKAALSLQNGKSSLNSIDDYTKLSLSATGSYAIREWISIKLELMAEKRDTDNPTGGYDRQTAGLYIALRY